jgi:hypothetical protein
VQQMAITKQGAHVRGALLERCDHTADSAAILHARERGSKRTELVVVLGALCITAHVVLQCCAHTSDHAHPQAAA